MSAIDDHDRMVSELVSRGIPRAKAEAAVRNELPRPAVDAVINQREADVEGEADRLMRSLGFVVIRLSQRRASKITAGVPDRYYLHPKRKLAVWVELKSPTGKPRPEQSEFQRMCIESGVHHVLGGVAELRAWLTANQVASFDSSGLPSPMLPSS